MSTDLPALVTAIGGAIVSVAGAVSTVILALKKVSPKERKDAADEASETDQSQDRRIAQLEQMLRDRQAEGGA